MSDTLPFQLRPNKYVERRLFVELLRMIGRIRSLHGYAYITMGGPFLEDIKLMYSEFGIEALLSIERDPMEHKRQIFNAPLPFLQCHNVDSSALIASYYDFLNGLGDPPNVVCWLDFQNADRTSQLADIRGLVPKLRPYDVLKVTLNAQPRTLDAVVDLMDDDDDQPDPQPLDPNLVWGTRFEALREQLGDFFPVTAEPKSMRRKELPKVLSEAVMLAIRDGLAEGIEAELLSAFSYSDGHQMLTVTVILLPQGTSGEFLDQTELRDWPFRSKKTEDVFEILVPSLSVRERIEIDRKINVAKNRLPDELKSFIEKLNLENYKRYCRFYPHFAKVTL